MFELRVRLTSGRTTFTHKEMMTVGEKAFNCPKCGRSHTYYSMYPQKCENLCCREPLPNLTMIHSLNRRIKYHYGLKEDEEFEEMMMWESIPSMYSRL